MILNLGGKRSDIPDERPEHLEKCAYAQIQLYIQRQGPLDPFHRALLGNSGLYSV